MIYIGNCKEDESWGLIFKDVKEMVQVIEDSEFLSLNTFLKLTNEVRLGWKLNVFGFHKEKKIVWAYDSVKDIYYFWAENV